MTVKCFWLEPSGKVALSLRRFVSRDDRDPETVCPGPHGYHDASVRVEDAEVRLDGMGRLGVFLPEEFEADPRWPAACACGYAFRDGDTRQVFQDRIYTRSDTGAEVPLREAPPGAMWDASWFPPDMWKGEDGRTLVVKLPNGHDWVVDSQANNCTMPEDAAQRAHHCWVREGNVPDITVGKKGVTCGAGAGSIMSGDWHGFLRDGCLVEV